ncbi:MAG TPA: hypothetical protein VMH81_11235 [Bryobacteraceae bacterium]|nr:hypothetical protein [Bryobacteraceae bacterium]
MSPILKSAAVLMGVAALCGPMSALEPKHGVVVGTVLEMDAASKTVAVKTADGAKHTFLFVEGTTLHGAKDLAQGTGDAFHGLEKGSRVVVHYTAAGGKETADEVDKLGDDGLKAVKVTVKHVDRATKTVAVETEDGSKESYRLTTRAAEEIGKGTGKGAGEAAHGTVYVTDEAGHKVVHFFERAI